MQDPVDFLGVALVSQVGEAGGTFPLTVTRARESHQWSLAFMGLLVFMAVSSTFGMILIFRSIPNWWAPEPGWLDVFVGYLVLVFSFLCFFFWFEGRRPEKVSLTLDGLSVLTRRGKFLNLNWNDPSFALLVRVD